MDAATVWRVWRRVLREPRLQEAMFSGDLPDDLGLDADGREVVAQYARTPAGTRFFIANYRYRMTSSFVNALETALPLTHRLLRANGIDVDALAVEFLDSVEWLDFGPYVYTYGGRVLDHVLGRPDLVAIPGLTDLARLERAGVRVTVEAAERGPDLDPVPGAYRAIGPVTAVRTELDLSGWLRDGSSLGRAELPRKPRTFLVYLRPPELRRRIVAVPPAAAALVADLRTPRPEERVREEERALLASLVKLGVVVAGGG